ncbi:MAG TPA: ABC transporter substrate-binding protein [Chlorobaculum sp.]|nr:ABC transporter substrate-binding protein [Chlorobaculum sp.]
MNTVDKKGGEGNVLAYCGAPPLNRKATGNGVPLLRKGAINLYMNMPCPLKVVCKMVIGEFAGLYNVSHDVPIYSPMLLDGDSKGIEGELKAAMTEDELPEVLIASGLHTVLSKGFRERFIDTGVYRGVTSESALAKMPELYRQLVSQHNIGIYSTGFWSVVCDLSLDSGVPYPGRWVDLVDPRYKDLITVHGYNGKASIASLLLLLREQLGSSAITDFAANIRNVWHFAEILKRIDSSEPRRTPFNLLPNAATVQMPSNKRGAILEFEDGPILAPMLMYVKASRMEECRPLINFMHSNIMRQALRRGDFHHADDFDWTQPFCFPSWDYLLQCDYEAMTESLNTELKKGLRPDVFQT